jgi:methionyl-tRNA formyltransferase
MINSIILLTNNEYCEKFSLEFKRLNPAIEIVLINDLASLIALPHSLLERSRLICCLSLVIVPLSIIKKLKYGAYNFHPGPPIRPGYAALEMAVYEGDEVYGTTLHEMDELVDAGKINNIHVFCVPKNTNAYDLYKLTSDSLFSLFNQTKEDLLDEAPLIYCPIPWGNKKFTKADYLSYLRISRDIGRGELELRIRAFGFDFFNRLKLIERGNIYELEGGDRPEGYLDQSDFQVICGQKFIRTKELVNN